MRIKGRHGRWAGTQLVVAAGAAVAVMAADVFVGPPPFNPNPGQQVSLQLVVDVGSAALGSYFFRFQYNPAVVHVVSVQGGTTSEFSGSPTTDPSTFASGSTPVAAAQGNANSPHGFVSVARVTLQAFGQAGDSSTLNALVNSLYDTQFNALPYTVFPSSVLISVPEVAVATDFRFLTKQNMTWTASGAVTSYNLYRGNRAPQAFAFNHACLTSGLASPNGTDSSAPMPDKGYYYLVSGVRNTVEGTLGNTSTGQPRPNALPCNGLVLDDGGPKEAAHASSLNRAAGPSGGRKVAPSSLGDVAQDGFIDEADARSVLEAIVGTRELSAAQWGDADVDADGRVTVADAQRLLQYAAGSIPSLDPPRVGAAGAPGSASVRSQSENPGVVVRITDSKGD